MDIVSSVSAEATDTSPASRDSSTGRAHHISLREPVYIHHSTALDYTRVLFTPRGIPFDLRFN
ncbi:hypothetical protein K523DRAFT_325495 [Schizophyllum commune Tattone D]|nr:hypothetical protein K523DRAFT_325495 [Schizophyllum commune Tattone D]